MEASSGGPQRQLGTVESLQWDNSQLRTLPVHTGADDITEPQQSVPGVCFSRAKPTPLEDPQLVITSASALELLGLNPEEATRRDDFAAFFSGNQPLPGSEPAAHCYCGHQFGMFSGQLGDGATMYLGEVLNTAGERWEVQFKGAGKTHYSRSADGRKVLRSSLREFLCSEANHALGVPTTRAGTLVTSDTRVPRDIHYNGNVTLERASVVLRIAHSFLRFGSFEICRPTDAVTGRAGPSVGKHAILEKLLDRVTALLAAERAAASATEPPAAPYSASAALQTLASTIAEPHGPAADVVARQRQWLGTFAEIVLRTARLVAHWQCVGFCHGVLNTDNMSVLGLTIDYGPFGFMDT